MPYSNFHIIVKSLLKKPNTVIYGDQIWSLMQMIMGDQYSITKWYKIIYQLKNRWYLLNIKKDVYYIKHHDQNIDTDAILTEHYRAFVRQHIQTYIHWWRYIGWLKALQIMMHNLEIPNELLVITESKQSHELIMLDKYMSIKSYHSKKKSLTKLLKPYTVPCTIQSKKFQRAWLELALLETLYNCDLKTNHYEIESVKKILSKYHKQIDYNTLISIIRIGKHHTSLNRLYILSKYIHPDCSTRIMEIIKKYSYFISV